MARKNKNCPHRRVCGNFCGNCEFSETFTRMQKHIDRLKRKLNKPVNVLVGGTPTQDVSRRATLPSDTPKTCCEYCAPLIACPVGEKRKVYICGDRAHDLTEMVLNRYEDHTDVFIHTEYGGDDFYRNTAYDIEHCPFCGRKLKEDS